jgi:hypothetical protein
MSGKSRSMHGRRARAVAAVWSSSRRSSDGASHGRHRTTPPQPGPPIRDPARAAMLPRRSSAAAVNTQARTRWRLQCFTDWSRRSTRSWDRPDQATMRSVRITLRARHRSRRHSRHRSKIEIPITQPRDPRVRSSATFVRLPAPETLHGSRPAAFALARLESGPMRAAACRGGFWLFGPPDRVELRVVRFGSDGGGHAARWAFLHVANPSVTH